jgi:hypothetical protein
MGYRGMAAWIAQALDAPNLDIIDCVMLLFSASGDLESGSSDSQLRPSIQIGRPEPAPSAQMTAHKSLDNNRGPLLARGRGRGQRGVNRGK